MTDCYKPRDECGLSSAIKDAATAKMPLVVRGAGSKSAMGRPLGGYAMPLTTERMRGVSLYEPTELVIGALPGTPVSEIDRMLAKHNQMLPFEPMDHRVLFGTSAEQSKAEAAGDDILRLCVEVGGCLTGEHGVGIETGKH